MLYFNCGLLLCCAPLDSLCTTQHSQNPKVTHAYIHVYDVWHLTLTERFRVQILAAILPTSGMYILSDAISLHSCDDMNKVSV